MRANWDPAHIASMDEHPACQACRDPMNLINGENGLFYGCSKYPDCRATRGAYQYGGNVGKAIPLVNPRLLAARLAIKEIVGALDLEGCEKVLKYARRQIK